MIDTSNYSKFFTFKELTNSASHAELVEQNRVDALLYVNSGKRLSKLLESVREILGNEPVKVNSGFRNTELNTAVGSKAVHSKHKIFEACDIKPSNMTVRQAFNKIKDAHSKGLLPDLRKVLEEGSWLHIEVSTSVGDYRGFFTSNDGNKTWTKEA